MAFSPLIGYHIFFGVLVVLGMIVIYSGWQGLFDKSDFRERMEPGLGRGKQGPIVTDLPPLAQRVLAAPLTDLGLVLARFWPAGKLEERLRRSGWRYQSIGDYYGSMVVMFVVFGALGAMIAMFFNVPGIGLLAVGLGVGAIGLFMPEQSVKDATDKRAEALFREMAWTVDRLAAVLTTGQALEQSLERVSGNQYAWAAGSAGGLFTALLRDISGGLATQRSNFGDYLDYLRSMLPANLPELDEFMQLVRLNVAERQSITEQLRALGASMRDQLNNRIDEAAQKAALKVTMLSTGVIIPITVVLIGGTALLQLMASW